MPPLMPPLGASKRAQAARRPRNTPKPGPASWQAIAERSRHESPRDLAGAYGVSYETLRTVSRRANAAERAASAVVADRAVGPVLTPPRTVRPEFVASAVHERQFVRSDGQSGQHSSATSPTPT